MKKFIAINGSPRKNWNTAQLLQSAMRGAQDAGADAEIIHLYPLKFKGCTSCFYCKLKGKEHGVCAMKDDLSPVLEKAQNCDALILGSPIYFMSPTSGMISLMERLFFSNYIYSDEIPTVFPKKLPSAFFYTMNMNEKHFEYFQMSDRLEVYAGIAEKILGVKPKVLYAYDTVQFKDYSKYESSIFDPEEKIAHREKFFDGLCKQAYDIGRDLILAEN